MTRVDDRDGVEPIGIAGGAIGIMAHVRLRLLGGFDLQVCGRASPTPSTRKVCALLAYLALHPDEPLQRDRLAGLLWGETPTKAARVSLRQCLAVSRRTIGHDERPCVLNDGTALRLAPGGIETDVMRFERCCEDDAPAALEMAIGLYRGQLLEGFVIEEEPFEEWLVGERRRLHERRLQLSSRLLEHYERTARTEDAIRSALDLLRLDPLHEVAHRSLMRCFCAEGRRHSALRQFQRCRETLWHELGVAPEVETWRLYRRLLGRSRSCDRVRSGERNAS